MVTLPETARFEGEPATFQAVVTRPNAPCMISGLPGMEVEADGATYHIDHEWAK